MQAKRNFYMGRLLEKNIKYFRIGSKMSLRTMQWVLRLGGIVFPKFKIFCNIRLLFLFDLIYFEHLIIKVISYLNMRVIFDYLH